MSDLDEALLFLRDAANEMDDGLEPRLATSLLGELDRLRGIIKDASDWALSILPKPGPYHPAVAALLREASPHG